MAYFDNNATTPLWPKVAEVMARVQAELWQNPSSPYASGLAARREIEAARERLAGRLGCEPGCIVFTSGATEANNAVVEFFAGREGGAIISAVEHPSIREPAQARWGERLVELGLRESGEWDFAALEAAVAPLRPAMVSVMAANNETGIEFPWREIARHCREAGVPFHCDATQWIGKRPLDGLGEVDFVSGCAHKFGGPRGVGFLKLPHPDHPLTMQLGGGQEMGHRGGTENTAGILGMDTALAEVQAGRLEAESTQAKLKATFEVCLKEGIPGLTIVGESLPRLWNTTLLLMPECENTRWVARLDHLGFQVATGSACATGKSGPSHVLAAHEVAADAQRRAVRVSSHWTTTAGEWSALAEAFVAVHETLKKEAPSGPGQVISVE